MDTNKLKELAELATPGPWTIDAAQSVIADSDQLNSGWVICECFGSDEKANRDFIKAANPQAILGLIAEVERLRGQIDNLINQHMPREPIPDMPGWTRVIEADRLKAENEQLRYLCGCASRSDISETLRGMIDAALEGGGR
jgi:hypothetical protein